METFMSTKKRAMVIAGNWKMYKTIEEANEFITALLPKVKESRPSIFLSVPFTAINAAAKAAAGSNIVIGAQNMNDVEEGAFTGEIAAKMLLDAGARFVILGHSERRHLFGESDDFINKKVIRAVTEGIVPLLCIGETLEERESGKTEEVLRRQIVSSLSGVTKEQFSNMIIAYEPVWAIGTGRTATTDVAQKTQAFCRSVVTELYGESFAEELVLLYGGSVKPSNARDFMKQEDIDGLLVGGASLDAEKFSAIVNYENALTH